MKKFIPVLIVAAAVGLTACSKEAEETTKSDLSEQTEESVVTEVEEDSEEVEETEPTPTPEPTEESTEETTEKTDNDFANIIYETSKPVVTDVSETEKDIVFYRGGQEIEGKLYLPEGDGPFPIVVMSSGLLQPASDYEGKAKGFVSNGYAALTFSFIDYSDPELDPVVIVIEDVLISEITDLEVIMDSLGDLPKVDTDSVYMWGHSIGGLITTYVGCERSSEIKGIIAVEPSLIAGERMYLDIEPAYSLKIYSLMENNETPMVIFVGTHDGFGDMPGVFDKALEAKPTAVLVTIDGADHFFTDDAETELIRISNEYLDEWQH